MKVYTPEISWHNREPIFGVDIQKKIEKNEINNKNFYRIVTCGSDNYIAIWRAYLLENKNQNKINSEIHQLVEFLIDKSVNDEKVLDPSQSINEDKNSEDKNLIELEIVCNLNYHIKAVNVAKFGPNSDILASGGDDSYVYIYQLDEKYNDSESQSEKDRCNPFNMEDQILIKKEKWKRVTTLRRHIEDVVDLAWSPDEKFLITGSVDNVSYVWDIKKSEPLYSLSNHSGYVQGVSWDPLNNYVVTLCTDRNLRIFTTTSKKPLAKINKIVLNEKEENSKNSFLFYDDTLATQSRRLNFSPNGEILAIPSGIIELDEEDEKDSDKFFNCVHFFFRDNIKKLHCYIPTGTYSNSISFCPKMFKLKPFCNNPYPFPYRLIFAIAAKDYVLVYDTQQPYPIAKISDIHYAKLSDLSWSLDGKILLVSSTDGYCTFIFFNDKELGEFYEGEPYKLEPEPKKLSQSLSTGKKNKEKKEENTVANENLSAEKVTPVNKITNFFKKITPLVPTKLENSFKQLEDKSVEKKENLKDENINNVVLNNKNDKKDDQTNVNKDLNSKKDIKVNVLQVKRKPAVVESNSNSLLQGNPVCKRIKPTPLDETDSCKKLENEENKKNKLKRNLETDSENENKIIKKKISLIQLD